MAVPNFQEIMLPALKLLNESSPRSVKEIAGKISDIFNLDDEERKALLPSGIQTVVSNRTNWSLYYMKRAGLLSTQKRGVYEITTLGKSVLESRPANINSEFLEQFEEFQSFKEKRAQPDAGLAIHPVVVPEAIQNETPEESLDSAYNKIRISLASDLMERIFNQSPEFFERLVIELLVKMGYGGSIKEAGKAIGKTGDEGIDGVIKEDKLGLDIIYIQAKRWAEMNSVGRPEIQKFVGALAGQGAKKGIFITTSRFTREALEYSPRNETKVVLIDGNTLCQLMIDYDIGVTPIARYDVKRVDNDYFE